MINNIITGAVVLYAVAVGYHMYKGKSFTAALLWVFTWFKGLFSAQAAPDAEKPSEAPKAKKK
ncbi:MAG TPA: hypothetical protein PKJ19_16290 [Flavobacteriales bacterium]|nr:hypothetical protein [Flavobacteriales bacterium]